MHGKFRWKPVTIKWSAYASHFEASATRVVGRVAVGAALFSQVANARQSGLRPSAGQGHGRAKQKKLGTGAPLTGCDSATMGKTQSKLTSEQLTELQNITYCM